MLLEERWAQDNNPEITLSESTVDELSQGIA
jgi:hypothetical protein